MTDDSCNFPPGPGSYALLLRLDRPKVLQIGRLGQAQLDAGMYIYLGSAHGPGGLRARLNRHIHTQGKIHWHIDYLRPTARLISIYALLDLFESPDGRVECRWSQALAQCSGAFCPSPGFGASDCTAGCPAHLIGFRKTLRFLKTTLARAAGIPPQNLRKWAIEV